MNINLLTGLVATAFGVIYTFMAYTLPNATIGNPIEPKIFPLMLGVGITICGILLIFIENKKKPDVKETKAEKSKGISHDNKLIIYTCFVTLVYALLFERIGYVLSTVVFMSAMLFALNGKEKWKVNLFVAAAFSIGVYIIFLKLLAIPLPMMPILEI